MNSSVFIGGLLLIFAVSVGGKQKPASPLSAAGTAFTFQGVLNQSGAPASGTYDLKFTLYDALTDGSQAGNPSTVIENVSGKVFFTVATSAPFLVAPDARSPIQQISGNFFGDPNTNAFSKLTFINPTPVAIGLTYYAGDIFLSSSRTSPNRSAW